MKRGSHAVTYLKREGEGGGGVGGGGGDMCAWGEGDWLWAPEARIHALLFIAG